VKPNDFIPERWSSQPELIKNKVGYAPFSLGKPQVARVPKLAHFSCFNIGTDKALSHRTAKLRRKTACSARAGDDGSDVTESLTDHFALTPGKLRLVFTPV